MDTLDLFGNIVIEQKPISRELMTAALIKQMQGITENTLAMLLTNPVDAIIEFSRLCNGEKAGQKISLLFNAHRLNTKTKQSQQSLVTAMQTPSFCSGLARTFAFKNGRYKDLFYQCLQLGINGVQYVNEFPPHIARDVYKGYGSKRVLDPCAGWGGRMIGAASIGAFYHGFEPSTRTYAGLLRLGDFLESFENGFHYRIENLPFEDATLTETYDVALTSPPYYDTEYYADEPTQAYLRYHDFSAFVDGFLFPMIDKVIKKTRFVLCVGSRKYPIRETIESKYVTKVLAHKLSGTGGLGKSNKEGEVFLEVNDVH